MACPDAPRTAAELAREKKLRDDPMADVHGPLFVTCKRCRSRIKLSPKSSYDPFHWMKHRERCLRKPTKQMESSSNTDGENLTPPPLTPDDDQPNVFRARSLSPNIDDLALPTTLVRTLDAAFLDYLDRSQRPLPKPVPPVDRWQTWQWSELRQPAWIAACEASDEDDDPVEPLLRQDP